jgi:deazaflavin-dependent oxidoreductase (nitroreductase family)
LIVCNVNPGFERPNPWPLNLRANAVARVQAGSERATYHARGATEEEAKRYWPRLVRIWPAYQGRFDRSGQRSLFILELVPQSDIKQTWDSQAPRDHSE